MMPTDAKREVTRAIEKAREDLDIALAELDRMPALDPTSAGFVAHALNNYLTVTEGTLELLKDNLAGVPDPEIARWLDALLHVANLMRHTVRRFVQAKPTTDFALERDAIDVPRLIDRACHYYRPVAAHKRQELVCRAEGDVPRAWADRVGVAVVADSFHRLHHRL